MRRRLWYGIAVLTLGLAFVTTGCGGGDDDEASDTQAATEEASGGENIAGDITVWAMGTEGEKLDVLAKDFMAENPDVKVDVTPIAWDVAHDKLITAVAGNKTPDISQMGTTWMGEFAKTGALDEVPDSIDESAFFDSAQSTGVVDDTAYGVPWYVETRVLYYRTDIAEKAGITAAPTTWDELKTMATAMKEKGGAKYGISLSPNNWQEYLPFVWQNGGDVMAGDEFTFDSPEAVEALDFYKSFFEEDLTAKSVPEGFDITPAFIQGTHPMFFSGPWHIGLITDTGGPEFEGKWAIAKMPVKETGTSFVGGSDLVVFKGSDNKEAAWKFVEYLSSAEVQQKWYETVSDLPSVESAWETGTLASDDKLGLFGEQLQDAKTPPVIPMWEQIAVDAVNTELEKATVGDSSAEDAAKAMQEKANSIGTE